ncbi:hypothetical protein CIG75_18045 [Tumebacillus algifaecis]|uniref:Uncharacterized protein n=1 Tax=Tumebacillus algifaecis TaxID=1214604 RepID=A0A223D5E5_9BACL|nr:hypothetical protein [Tumebacillus algifaecis]ASS76683.1 hypothetical protein CIG75_18045 [Tumebacillus algifaecis]
MPHSILQKAPSPSSNGSKPSAKSSLATPVNKILQLQKTVGNQAVLHMLQKKTAPTAQLKSDKKLMHQLDPYIGWAMDKIASKDGVTEERPRGTGLLQFDAQFQLLFQKINEYDRSKDGRPSVHQAMIEEITTLLNKWSAANKDKLSKHDQSVIIEIQLILIEEWRTNFNQADRLDRYTKDQEAPYKLMTDEGALWSDEQLEYSTSKVGKTGFEYFQHLSTMNRASMAKEMPDDRAPDWAASVKDKVVTALNDAVLNHYTTSARADALEQDGALKAKTLLQKDNPTYKHNTSAYDEHALANHGFTFFFIESPDAGMRQTRFGKEEEQQRSGASSAQGDSAQISLGLKDSGLLDKGWLMLSDFAQREYPDLMTEPGKASLTSWLPTRAHEALKTKPGFTEKVRSFQTGRMTDDQFDESITAGAKTTDREKRQVQVMARQQAYQDQGSHQVYGGGGDRQVTAEDRIYHNLLVGPDIIPGLAERTVLEIARIQRVNPELADKLIQLDGPELLKFMFKDLFRPQAMIPNAVDIKPGNIKKF